MLVSELRFLLKLRTFLGLYRGKFSYFSLCT
jgi:hypothetical protein